MPKQKKIVKYVTQGKYPSIKTVPQIMEKCGLYNDIEVVRQIVNSNYSHDEYFVTFFNDRYSWIVKDNRVADWKVAYGEWRVQNLYRRIYPFTPEFNKLNTQFLAEYDSRQDLQEIYTLAFKDNWALYDKYGNRHTSEDVKPKGWDTRPESFLMFDNIIRNSIDAKEKIEVARPTPYQAGDLVLLRATAIDTDDDPLCVPRYSTQWGQGARTPGKEVERIGTLLKVTNKLDSWRAGRGTKLLTIQWMGQETMVNVPERAVKWHMRPTLKNGLKTPED